MKPLDILAAVTVAVLWGMGFIVAKAGMTHFSPILLMALRFSVTALCLVWFFRPSLKFLKQLFFIALIGSTLQYSLTFTGVSGINASTSALLVQLEVPFGLLIAWLVLGEKLTPRQFIGVIIAIIGVILIIGEPKLAGDLHYAFLVIGGAFTWAIGQIMIKKLGKVGGFNLLSGVAVLAAPQLFLASFALESAQLQQIKTAPLAAWAAVAYLSLLMTTVAYALWYRLLGLYPVNKVIPYLLLLPVASVLGGVIFLNEQLTAKIFSGGLLALLGVAIITLAASPDKPAPDKPTRD